MLDVDKKWRHTISCIITWCCNFKHWQAKVNTIINDSIHYTTCACYNNGVPNRLCYYGKIRWCDSYNIIIDSDYKN